MDFYAEKRALEEVKNALDGGYLRSSKGPEVVAFIERAYQTYYKDATNRPPDSYSHAGMQTALELIADDLLVKTPGALDIVSTFASEGYTWSSDDLENALAFAVSRLCESAEIITYSQREALWAASSRENIFGWGRCVRFAVFSYPHDPNATIARLKETEFTDRAVSPRTYLEWFLRFTEGELLDHTIAAISALFMNASTTLIARLFDELDDRALVQDGLPLMAPWTMQHPRWSQREFCQMCQRLELRVAAPALRWIVSNGHRSALVAACEALESLGSTRDVSALKLVSDDAWDQETAEVARRALQASRYRQPPSASHVYLQLDTLAERTEEPTGWSFEERQLLDLCSRGCVTNSQASALAKLDEDTIDTFHELFADRVRRYCQDPDVYESSNINQGVWLSSEAPFDRGLHAAKALIQLIDSPKVEDETKSNALESLFHIAGHGQLRLDEDLAETVGRLANSTPWQGRKRLQLLTCALPYDLDDWLEAIDAVNGFDDIPKHEHHHILQIEDDAKARACLVSFYNLCDEMRLRGLLSELDMSAHARFFPIWIRLTATVSASTRKLIAARLAATESLLVEPYFQAVAQDAAEDQQIRVAAIEALGQFGGRLCIAALLDAQGTRALRASATAAIASIEARFPAAEYASRGSLSLAEAGELSGALTQMGAGEGDISIYQDVLEAARFKGTRPVGEPREATDGADALVARREQRIDVARLSAPPRSILTIRFTYALVGTDLLETSSFYAICIGLTIVLSVLGSGVASMICPGLILIYGLGMLFAGLTSDRNKADLELLKRGYIAPGRLLETWTRKEGSSDSQTTVHGYKFEFMAESGRTHTFTHKANRALRALTDEEHEPILYILGDDGELLERRPFDAMKLVRINKRGRPTPSASAWFFMLLDATCFAGCAWFLLRTYLL